MLTSVRVSETIRKAPDHRHVLPRSEWLNKFHRRQTDKQTNRQTDKQTRRRTAPMRKVPALATEGFNPLESRASRGNYSATSNNMKLVHWPLMGGLLHLVQRGGDWAGPQPAQAPPRCTKCNSIPINGQCTNHCIAV